MRVLSLLSVAFLLLLGGQLNAQRQCAAETILHQHLLEDPAFRQEIENIERHTEQFIQNSGGVSERVVVTIPVVFNVVWNTTAENIADSRLTDQLAVLNADFRKLNADASSVPSVWQGIAADCEINFCLATRDPNGNATTGIRRQQTSVTAFSTNDAVKFTAQGGLDAWDRNQYLNLWVCDISGGILGYAQFPGGAAATDGVVLDYLYVGTTGATAPFNKGRTATHEVGHWLNLYHIWGDDGTACTGSDNCADTPNQADENYGCPTFPNVSCSNGPNGDMFMNYMDYTDDACMYMFTAGQKARMQALFATGGSRVSLLTSQGCSAPNGGGGSCGTPAGLNATSIAQTSATLNWGAVSGATAYTLQWKLGTATTWTTVSNLTGTSYALTGLTANTAYNFQVRATCGTTTGTYSTAATFTTLAATPTCSDILEPNNSLATAKTISVNTNYSALIASTTDVDWYKFSNTTLQRNIKVDLTTLPADFDVRLYRNSTQVGISQNTGTANEQIILNNATVSTAYYANVYGYNGANSATQCYTLRVSLSSTAWRTDGSTDGVVTELEVPVQFGDAGFVMYPNPANEALNIQVEMTADQAVQVNVLDAAGRVAVQQNRTLSKGDNLMQVDLSRLANGIYFVQVRNGEQASTRRLVVQH